MTAFILDGKKIAAGIEQTVQQQIQQKLDAGQRAPGLVVILVGDSPASQTYVQHKRRACEKVGIRSTLHHLPSNTSQEALAELIDQCNQNPEIDGILLQLPLPAALDATPLLERIAVHKDVDGFHPYNMGRLAQRNPLLTPCTPRGIMTLLKHTQVELAGKHAVVVGASNIVGRPMALELLLGKCTVTVCHRFTTNLQDFVAQADILVAAIGKPGIIQSEQIKPGAIVIDVGFTRLADGRICGDIDFDRALPRAGWITPVPGGVGPLTVASLLENTVFAANLVHSARGFANNT